MLQPAHLNALGQGGEKTIEDTYQKLTQLDHILLRPDTYIGSTEAQQQKLWVHDGHCAGVPRRVLRAGPVQNL